MKATLAIFVIVIFVGGFYIHETERMVEGYRAMINAALLEISDLKEELRQCRVGEILEGAGSPILKPDLTK